MQRGATKIFLRQFAFINLEKSRSQILTDSAVKAEGAARRFIFRCRFIRKMHCIVQMQASGRRFLARKYMVDFRKKRAVIGLQTLARAALAKRKFNTMQAAAIGIQKVARAHVARKGYNIFHARIVEARRLDRAATTIQCVFRNIVASHVYVHTKSVERRPSKLPSKLEGKGLKAAIKADKAAGIARQTAKDRERDFKTLTTQLGKAAHTTEKAKATEMELAMVQGDLAAALAELAATKEELATMCKRINDMERENVDLKQKVQSGAFVPAEAYKGRMYVDYPDLEELDKNLFTLKAQSRKGKDDLKALLGSFQFAINISI